MSKSKITKPLSQNVGSVSSGTMRPEDLIPDFIWELRNQRPLHRSHRKLIREIESEAYDARGDYQDHDSDMENVDALMDALNDYAPEGFYFGAHPGDGADYGFWLSEEFADEFDGLRVGDTSEVPPAYSGLVLHVNDHGNMSLYHASRGGRWREIWAIV